MIVVKSTMNFFAKDSFLKFLLKLLSIKSLVEVPDVTTNCKNYFTLFTNCKNNFYNSFSRRVLQPIFEINFGHQKPP
jgi:hypothetical protein